MTDEQHRRARLQQIARRRQRVGEDHRLELAGGVGEHAEGELVAALRLALARRDDDAGEASLAGAALGHRLEFRVALDAELLQNLLVAVERMAGEIEADGIELVR